MNILLDKFDIEVFEGSRNDLQFLQYAARFYLFFMSLKHLDERISLLSRKRRLFTISFKVQIIRKMIRKSLHQPSPRPSD